MKTSCTFIVICTLLLFISSGNLHAATLHVVITADTQAEDIQSGIKADLYLMDQELSRISRYTGLQIKKRIFSDAEFDPVLVLDHVKALEVKSEDVVIYYHASHGFRTFYMDNAWPALDFGKKPAIDFADIVEIIKTKPQRFALLLADCCNNCISIWSVPPFYRQELASSWNSGKYRIHNYRKLFLEQRGIVIAAAASPGQYAWINAYFGGFFTSSFLAQLKQSCDQRTGDIQWSTILEKTKGATHDMCVDLKHSQDPLYLIELEPID